MRKVLVIGHRGACGYFPENTILSLKKAIEMGVDAVEFDVRMTKDGVLILFHDEKLDRLLRIHGKVRDRTYDFLKKFTIRGEKIPTLEEALQVLKNKNVKIVVEVKEPDTIDKVIDIISRSGIEKDRFLIVSFYHTIIKKVKESGYRFGAIFVCRPISIRQMFSEVMPDVVLPRQDMLDRELIDEAHSLGVMVGTWVINDESDLQKVIDLGVDMVASDYPDKIIRALKQTRLF
ncbi:MAG: hypothetical protein GXO10_01970 [Crenarchaeota archaeon]|nr:hypothetical protein [Thermoproteota archaeon]